VVFNLITAVPWFSLALITAEPNIFPMFGGGMIGSTTMQLFLSSFQLQNHYSFFGFQSFLDHGVTIFI